MSFEILIEPEVLEDIRNSHAYYEEKLDGLGDRFIEEVTKCIEDIKLNPYYEVRYGKIRCVPLKVFPYLIHFALREETAEITIHAVFNTYQNPDKYPKK